MTTLIKTSLFSVLLVMIVTQSATADIVAKTSGMDHQPGLLDLYRDHDAASVYIALKKGSDGLFGRFIYAPALAGGLGSNPVGLDRARAGGSHLLIFRRVGNQIMAEIENSRFLARSVNPAEVDAVRRSFAHSVIWSTDIVAEDGDTVLIDFSGFILRDAIGIARQLKARRQGSFRLVKGLSYVRPEAAFSFPTNLEFDAVLTFSSDKPGPEVRATTPDPTRVSLIHHTSLIKLPEAGYETRRYDDRAGLIGVSHVDMAQALDGDVVQRLARRFRLQKDDTGAVINPIRFYVDSGAPKIIRDALVEGASWWASAFEKAGFPGGYTVDVLPDGVHPLDARYNVINWVHRATRGWSYGAALYDPRTGEALRGIVILGSLRLRQDIKIFEALMGAERTGQGRPGDMSDPVQVALARVRQLSAHEVGHTLGFGHNMAASSYGRASVMDYPAPDIRLREGRIDASKAYAVGMGAWDDFTVDFLYSDYGEDSDAVAQAKRVKQADDAGLVYVSDLDSRSPATGHPAGALWDNGSDPIAELASLMALRRHALDRFGEANLRPDENFNGLHTKIVPLYLYHRYQINAVAKLIGGVDFRYQRQGDGRAAPSFVSVKRQSDAVSSLLQTLSPQSLSLSDRQLALLTPVGADTMDPQFARETVKGKANPAFDLVALSSAATEAVYTALFAPRRLERIKAQEAHMDIKLSDYLAAIGDFILSPSRVEETGKKGNPIMRPVLVQQHSLLVDRLISVVDNPAISQAVRGDVRRALDGLVKRLSKKRLAALPSTLELKERIADALSRRATPAYKPLAAPSIPPGSPIGAETCWHGCP